MQDKNHSSDGARNTPKSILNDPFLLHSSGDGLKPFRTVTNARATRAGPSQQTGFHGSDDSCDISEIITIAGGDEDNSQNSSLPPLASEMFKQELYIRGYLKRPTSRPSNVVPRKQRILMFASRNVFQVLGRRQGRKVAECLKAEQDAAETGVLDPPESTTVVSATLRTPHANALDSPWVDTNTTPSESFDLHEFSYITAFTTPPSSPSIVDADTFNKGVGLGDSIHAV